MRSAMRLERSKIRLQECKELISEAKKKENRPKKGSGHLRRNTRMKEKAQKAAILLERCGIRSSSHQHDYYE
jgi:hypothetical protein